MTYGTPLALYHPGDGLRYFNSTAGRAHEQPRRGRVCRCRPMAPREELSRVFANARKVPMMVG